MRILLDTHAVLWWLSDDDRLSSVARDAIAAADEPLLSAGTLFEVAIKASLGKLKVPDDWASELTEVQHFSLLAILPAHARALREMPFVTVDGAKLRDPFDRLLVAQAKVEGVPVVTRDPAILAHGASAVW